NVGDYLPADTLLTSLVGAHHAAGRAHDRHSHAALNLGQLARRRVATPAGLGDTLEPGDHRLAILRVLETQSQYLEVRAHALPVRHAALDIEALDVTLALKQLRKFFVEIRRGNRDVVEVRGYRVSNARQEICCRVAHRKFLTKTTSSSPESCPGA